MAVQVHLTAFWTARVGKRGLKRPCYSDMLVCFVLLRRNLSSRHLGCRCCSKFRQPGTGSVVINRNAATTLLSRSTFKTKILQDLPSNTLGKKVTFHSMCARTRMILFFISCTGYPETHTHTVPSRPHARGDHGVMYVWCYFST